MLYYFGKLALTSILVVLVSELTKRSSLLGALLASIPLVSVLAMIWLYVDTGDVEQTADLADSIFWLVLPSLALFIALLLLLRGGAGLLARPGDFDLRHRAALRPADTAAAPAGRITLTGVACSSWLRPKRNGTSEFLIAECRSDMGNNGFDQRASQ
jgi:hypothetical protein